MKKLLALILLVTTVAQAQYSVKGSMNPPNETDWVILYKIEGAKQRFVANTNTKIDTVKVNGEEVRVANFEFTMPEGAKPGMYRVAYRQEAGGFANFLFNNENVEFSFNPNFPEQSIVYTKSKENMLFNEFLQANALTQKTVDSLQVAYLKNPSEDLKKRYPKAVKKVTDVYKIYEDKSKGMLASHFVKAMQRDNATEISGDAQKYFSNIVSNFFNNIDFNSKELYNSSILIDRVSDYVFYLNYSSEPELQDKLFKESVATVMGKISDTKLKKETLEFLISQFARVQKAHIVDGIFSTHYNKLPASFQDAKFRSKTLGKLQAAIGRIAPDFSWKDGKKKHKLSTLKDGENYLLIFWSTSCSHCLKEIPELYKYMQKTQPDTKVIAYALETEDFEWNEYKKQLYGWHHAIGLNKENKWDNTFVTDTYQVHATPSYFVLDKNKKIIAKPRDFEVIKKYYAVTNPPKKEEKKTEKKEKE